MNKSIKGSLALILAAGIYGMYGVYARMIGKQFGAFSQYWIRTLTICIILLIYFVIRKNKWKKIEKKDLKWFIIWPLSGVGTSALIFIAFNHLAIGISYFLIYSTMILGGLLSGRIFFKEKLTLIKVIAILMTLIGFSLIYSLNINRNLSIFALMCLLGGLFTGFWNTLSKKVSNKYPNLQLILIDSSLAFIFSMLGALIVKESLPDPLVGKSLVWIFIQAASQMTTVGLVIYGFKNLEAQIGSIILPIEVVFAAIFGYVFFAERLSFSSSIGGALIVAAVILPNLKSKYFKRLNSAKT